MNAITRGRHAAIALITILSLFAAGCGQTPLLPTIDAQRHEASTTGQGESYEATMSELAYRIAVAQCQSELTKLIKDETMKKATGDNEALLAVISGKPLPANSKGGSTTFAAVLGSIGGKGLEQTAYVDRILEEYPTAHVACYDEDWDGKSPALVTYLPEGDDSSWTRLIAYDETGKEYVLDPEADTEKPLIVVGLNERVDEELEPLPGLVNDEMMKSINEQEPPSAGNPIDAPQDPRDDGVDAGSGGSGGNSGEYPKYRRYGDPLYVARMWLRDCNEPPRTKGRPEIRICFGDSALGNCTIHNSRYDFFKCKSVYVFPFTWKVKHDHGMKNINRQVATWTGIYGEVIQMCVYEQDHGGFKVELGSPITIFGGKTETGVKFSIKADMGDVYVAVDKDDYLGECVIRLQDPIAGPGGSKYDLGDAIVYLR
jgi:hypothetical protein